MNNTELTEADYTKLLDYREAAAALVLLAYVGEKLHQNGPWSSNSKLPLRIPMLEYGICITRQLTNNNTNTHNDYNKWVEV